MRRGARPLDDLGVSPVVGMIMILAISVVGIAAVIAWGLPAVDEMKAQVEATAVRNQFLELDADVKQLVAGTSEKTAKRWQPSLSRGSIDILAARERWVFGYSGCAGGGTSACNDKNAGPPVTSKEYSFTLIGVADTDYAFSLYNNGTSAVTLAVTAATINNGAESKLVVSTSSTGTPASPATQMTNTALAAGTSIQLYLYDSSGGNQQKIDFRTAALSGSVFRFTVTDSASNIAARFWVFDAGEARYRLDTTGALKTVFLTNGAVVIGNGGKEIVENTPGVPPPKSTPDGYKVFLRGIAFQGSTSFAGNDHFDVLLTLYGTNALANEAAVGEYYMYVSGEHKPAWDRYFSRDNGYKLAPDPNVEAAFKGYRQRVYTTDFVPLGFTYVHSVVTVEV